MTIGTGATHGEWPATRPPGSSLDVVGTQAKRYGRFADLGESTLHPRTERAGSGFVTVDDRHQLDVAVAKRHDSIAGAVPSVTPAGNRCEPELLVEAAGRRIEISHNHDHVVDGQHPTYGTTRSAPGDPDAARHPG